MLERLRQLRAGRVVGLAVAGLVLYVATHPSENAHGQEATETSTVRVGLRPGSALDIGNYECSMGFLATNDAGERLAVTAGHCAQNVGQQVHSHDGTLIGEVVQHIPDDFDHESFGVTVIRLSANTYTADAYFTSFGNPEVGDGVTKYGVRTDKTDGKVTTVDISPERPGHSLMESTLVGLPGDSGAAWFSDAGKGPKLLGLNIGYTKRADGGYGFAFGIPIDSLIALIKQNSPELEAGFMPVSPPAGVDHGSRQP